MAADLIAFQERRLGSTLMITGLLGHGHVALGAWRLLDSFDLPIVSGQNYIEYDDDGRIVRIVGYFDVGRQQL